MLIYLTKQIANCAEAENCMENSKPSSWDVCVTCQFWGGERKASTFRDRAEYGSDGDTGECVGGGWDGSQKSAMSSCNKWERWGVLK